MMRETIHSRLSELRAQFEAGQAQVKELQDRQIRLHDTLLRISGAIQVLEELLNEEHTREREAGYPVNGAASVTAPVG